MNIIEMKGNLGGFTLLKGRVPEGHCPECIVKHDPSEPHNWQSLHYQMAFKEQHGRFPTWHDAMRHCAAKIKALWLDELAAHGVIVGPDEHAPKPVKECPILFSGPMVRAILAGRKTQTRRIVKCPVWVGGVADDERPRHTHVYGTVATVVPCPYGQPGDRLWVRESFYCDTLPFADGGPLPKNKPDWADDNLYYRADGTCCQIIPECACAEVGKPKFRPSIHMPRWASRITLEIVSVRVERLQDITDADAISEGIERDAAEFKNYNAKDTSFNWLGGVGAAKLSYSTLWKLINGPDSWQENPWVWVVEFKHVEGAEA